jgi:hypothetical protein
MQNILRNLMSIYDDGSDKRVQWENEKQGEIFSASGLH